MHPPREALLLLACLLLAGCSLPGDESSSEGPRVDRSEYAGSGTGLAVALQNDAPEPVNVTLALRSSDGATVASYEASVASNATAEKWWSLGPGGYVLEMRYQVRSGARTASGDGEAAIEIGACEEIARVGWRFLQVEDTYASAPLPESCASAGG